MTPPSSQAAFDRYLPRFQGCLGRMTWRLHSLVEAETPTNDKQRVDALGGWLATWAETHGAKVTVHPQQVVGDLIECRWNPDAPARPILILCHIDTVHPAGSTDKRPTRIEGDVLHGVGAYDMKAGISVVLSVLGELHDSGELGGRPVTVLFTTDEEIGSPYSRRVTERLAEEAGLALVMEFCNYDEDVVTSRKGVGIFQITAVGEEAHSAAGPSAGINAVVEMAKHVERVTAIARPDEGTLVTPTVIRGGTRHNVIPGFCELVINVRVRYKREADRVFEALLALTEAPWLPGAELILTGDYMRPPMERDAVMDETFETLKAVAGVPLTETSRGGGSDGNLTAVLGTPTLDGLGPAGQGAHRDDEQVYLPSLPRRAALLASILTGWPEMA